MITAGDRIEVEARRPVNGGAMIGAVSGEGAEGATVFLRHALPDEAGTAVVTSVRKGGRLVFADLIEVRRASPDRVRPPCPYSVPGACGGCDFQHAALPAQRRLKADIVADALRRVGRFGAGELAWDGVVQPVPGERDGLRWRTRSRFAVRDGGLAMHRWRSSETIGIEDCLIAAPEVVGAARAAAAAAPLADEVGAVVSSLGEVRAGTPSDLRTQRVHERVGARVLELGADAFWQVHPGAPQVLADAVAEVLQLRPGELLLDLYAGAGMFTAALADAGPGRVDVVEGDRRAAAAAQANLGSLSGCRVARSDVAKWLAAYRGRPDAVVLDPPRDGAGARVVNELDRIRPGRIAYVACDPVSLARDLRTAVDLGWQVESLAAFDLFPMTHHVECVAGLRPGR